MYVLSFQYFGCFLYQPLAFASCITLMPFSKQNLMTYLEIQPCNAYDVTLINTVILYYRPCSCAYKKSPKIKQLTLKLPCVENSSLKRTTGLSCLPITSNDYSNMEHLMIFGHFTQFCFTNIDKSVECLSMFVTSLLHYSILNKRAYS